jgi:hypothetical protein
MASEQRKKPIRGKKDKPAGALRVGIWLAAAIGLLLVATLGVYAYYRAPAKNTDVSKMSDVEKLSVLEKEIEELEANSDPEDSFSEDRLKLAILRQAFDEKSQKLPEEEKDERMEQWIDKRLGPHLATFFALSPEERSATAKKIVDGMVVDEQRRRAWEAERADRPPRAPEGGAERADRPPGAPRGPEGGAAGGQPRRGRGEAGRGGGWFSGEGRGTSTAEKHKERMRIRLSHTTPEYRGQRTEFVRMIQQERQERGLPPASTRDLFRAYRNLAVTTGGSSSGPPLGPRP